MNALNGTITKDVTFDAAHRLPLHQGKCAHLHGHRYRLTFTFDGPIDQDTGMVADYGDIKTVLTSAVVVPLDHGTMVWDDDTALGHWLETNAQRYVAMALPPTAEVIAAWCYAEVRRAYDGPARLRHVTVHETPSSSATYPQQDD